LISFPDYGKQASFNSKDSSYLPPITSILRLPGVCMQKSMKCRHHNTARRENEHTKATPNFGNPSPGISQIYKAREVLVAKSY
jgi:hypothetical protein